jgi:hypothetical protein
MFVQIVYRDTFNLVLDIILTKTKTKNKKPFSITHNSYSTKLIPGTLKDEVQSTHVVNIYMTLISWTY